MASAAGRGGYSHDDDFEAPRGRGSAGGAAGGGGGGGRQEQRRIMEALELAFPLYFDPEEASYSPTDGRVMVAQTFATWFGGAGSVMIKGNLAMLTVIHLNFVDLRDTAPVTDLTMAMVAEPHDVLACLGMALCAARAVRFPGLPAHKITVRVEGVEPLSQMRSLKSNSIGRLVAVKGNVVRVSSVRPLVRKMAFTCNTCGSSVLCRFEDGKYEPPTKCNSTGCRGRQLTPNRVSAETVDWQKIRIQEIDEHNADAGRIPRTLECELTEDLVDSCVPGDIVVVAGVVKSMNVEVAAGRGTARAKSLFLLYVDAVSVTNTKSSGAAASSSSSGGGEEEDAEYSTKELYMIQQIAHQPNLFYLLVASLAPGIFGQEMVKAGLCLGLFGGSQHAPATGAEMSIRSDPHVLVVGDPGLGKSQLLRAVSALSPRGVYVCGNTTSTTGLTVTIVKDSITGDFVLEAGALILGDQGICCIDEFDKMGAEHQALLEAMEQQSISIAKAGIVANLSARTSVIAAANPVGGHYDRGKTVQENLKLNAALLSRFDLLFILLDRPDTDRDNLLSAHVMKLHSHRRLEQEAAAAAASSGIGAGAGAGVGAGAAAGRAMTGLTSGRFGGAGAAGAVPGTMLHSRPPVEVDPDAPLLERLRLGVQAVRDPIPRHHLKRYIAYARRYVTPVLSHEAAAVLQQFYMQLRREHGDEDAAPITTRQLESLIRLSQARAKMELREASWRYMMVSHQRVTEADARDVVEIMKAALIDAYTDEFGVIDFSRANGMSMSKQVKAFVAALNRAADQRSSAMFSMKDFRELVDRLQLRVPSLGDFIEILNQQNYVLKKGNGVYQLQTSAYSQTGVGRRNGGAGASQGLFGHYRGGPRGGPGGSQAY